MAVQQLKIENFRNLQPVKLAVPEGVRVVALVGPNGAGKTSVLEAVSLLGGGRGLLSAEAKGQLQIGQKSWSIWAETLTATTVAAGFSQGAKKTLVDDRAATAEGLAGALPVIWLAPRLDRFFYESPAERRAWLDEQAALLRPGHVQLVGQYQHHKRSRLTLLRQGKVNGDWIDAEERLMAETGLALLRSRLDFLADLNGVLTDVRLQLAGTALEVLQEEDPVAALAGKFARSREIDARLERTHAGPDTLDLAGTLTLEKKHKVSLANASSGQHKRALVRLVVGMATLLNAQGKRPVVLIDELGAHLDVANREKVLGELVTLGCQVWVTDTEFAATAESVQVIRVEQGMLTPV